MRSPLSPLAPASPLALACAACISLTGCLDLDDLLGEPPECERDRDCDDDEECDDGECVDEEDDDGGEGEGEGEGEGDVPPDPEGPRFLQFNTNITTVTDSDAVIFTAVLTDDDGIDDIIGGSLVDPATDLSYGSFQTSAAEGSYELTLTWDAINTVGAIDFATNAQRGFRGRFFDVAGHVVEQTLTLTLSCEGDPACDGDCGSARCADERCTSVDGNQGFDEAGNALCGNECRSLVSADDCGRCNLSCDGPGGCIPVNVGEGALPFCGCGNGLDCRVGEACFAVLTDDAQAICQPSDGAIDNGTGFPVQAVVDIGGQFVPLCDGLSLANADLYCAANGHASAQVFPATATTEEFGFDVDCAGVSSFIDCRFTLDEACLPASVQCD